MARSVGIFGTSGFARELGDIAYELGFSPIYIASDESEIDAWEFEDEVVPESQVARLKGMGFAIGIGDNVIRQRVAQRFLGKVEFLNLIHPDASFGRKQREHVAQAQGVIICAGVRFTNNIQVGNFSVFNLNVTIGHDVVVEEFVNIAPGASISGNVHLKARSWVGTGAVINQGRPDHKLLIGEDTVIGAGAVVVKACDPHATYAGVPAVRLK